MEHTAIIITQSHDLYVLALEKGPQRLVTGKVAGKLRHRLKEPADFPAVGDHVHISLDEASNSAVITALLPRRSQLGRIGDPKTRQRQIIAANLDVLVVCTSLNQDFSLRRVERYFAAAHAGNVEPVLVLTKADLCPDPDAAFSQARAALPGSRVLLHDAVRMQALPCLTELLRAGKTLGFAGSSGVGKSTLINALMGEEAMRTSSIRLADGKGRHTTTHRELLFTPHGGAVIDTPGMRAFALDDANVDAAFVSITELLGQCRFSNCSHTSEPGCALRAAVEDGRLDAAQLRSYLRLTREGAGRVKPWERKR